MTLDTQTWIGISVVALSLVLLYLCWFTEPKGGDDV